MKKAEIIGCLDDLQEKIGRLAQQIGKMPEGDENAEREALHKGLIEGYKVGTDRGLEVLKEIMLEVAKGIDEGYISNSDEIVELIDQKRFEFKATTDVVIKTMS